MNRMVRLIVASTSATVACSLALATGYRIDGTLPAGGHCPQYGDWDSATKTCRIENAQVAGGDSLRIDSATVEVVGTLVNHGTLDNRGTLVVSGFLDSPGLLINFWSGTLINRGQIYSFFMYNFGGLANDEPGTIEFGLHVENNAPLTNHGHIAVAGDLINIPGRTIENFGSIAIAPAGHVTNSGRLVHAGQIDNAGILTNEHELIAHCESSLVGNALEGQPSTAAQALYVAGASLEWCPIEGAAGYDVVEGGLGELRSAHGDFTAVTIACIGNDLLGTSLELGADPPAGEGRWFLVRANGIASADFDTVFSSQVGSRSEAIAASAGACP